MGSDDHRHRDADRCSHLPHVPRKLVHQRVGTLAPRQAGICAPAHQEEAHGLDNGCANTRPLISFGEFRLLTDGVNAVAARPVRSRWFGARHCLRIGRSGRSQHVYQVLAKLGRSRVLPEVRMPVNWSRCRVHIGCQFGRIPARLVLGAVQVSLCQVRRRGPVHPGTDVVRLPDHQMTLSGLIATHPELTFVGSDEGRFHARARIEQWRKGTPRDLDQARPRILRLLRCSKAL